MNNVLGKWLFDQYKVYGGFLRENQIGNAGLAWSTGDMCRKS